MHMGLTRMKKGSTFPLLASEYARPSVVNTTPQVQSRQHCGKISDGHGNGDGYGNGIGDVTGCWNWMLELRWTGHGLKMELKTELNMDMELDVGNRTVYLACVYKLVPVVWSDIDSCVVLPWLGIDPMPSFSHIHLFLFISVDIRGCFVTREGIRRISS